jgi:pyrrolidone-carboxylate peptidase
LLAHFENTQTRVAFIHVPYVIEQGKEPAMSIDQILKGLLVAIEHIDD